jgi:hypothetical protein
LARHGQGAVGGSAVLEASMTRIKVSNMRDNNALRELGKELVLLDDSNRSKKFACFLISLLVYNRDSALKISRHRRHVNEILCALDAMVV